MGRSARNNLRTPQSRPSCKAASWGCLAFPPTPPWRPSFTERGRSIALKLIIAIVQPSKLDDVKSRLTQIEVVRLTVLPCQGFARTRGRRDAGDAAAIAGGPLNLLPKMQLQIAVNDAFVDPTVEAIQQAVRSEDGGQPGDGKIFILPMDDCIRIRTGQRGPEAI